jgi:tetratricopeptide (TPR) repeat protein
LLKWPGWEDDRPDWLQQIAATEISFLAAVGILLDFSLVEKNDNSDSYSMHAVVHDWIHASINTRTNDDFLQKAITTIGLAVPRQEIRDFATIQRRLLPHVAQLLLYWKFVTATPDFTDTTVYLSSLHMLGDLCTDQGKLNEAEQMYQRALQGNEKTLGPEHTSTLRTVNNLGNLYKSQGKLDEAEQMYQRARRS